MNSIAIKHLKKTKNFSASQKKKDFANCKINFTYCSSFITNVQLSECWSCIYYKPHTLMISSENKKKIHSILERRICVLLLLLYQSLQALGQSIYLNNMCVCVCVEHWIDHCCCCYQCRHCIPYHTAGLHHAHYSFIATFGHCIHDNDHCRFGFYCSGNM